MQRLRETGIPANRVLFDDRRSLIFRYQECSPKGDRMKSTETHDEKPLTSLPKIVSREEWQRARDQFLIKEKAATKARDALSAERRRLPMVRIDKDYVFDGPSGKV